MRSDQGDDSGSTDRLNQAASGVSRATPVLLGGEQHADASPGRIVGIIASIVFHLWLVAMFATVAIPDREPPPAHDIESKFSEPVPVEEIEPKLTYELANPDDAERDVRQVINARSTGLAVVREVQQARSAPTPRFDDILPPVPKTQLYDIPEGLELDDRMVIKGTTGDASIQIESALDRVTWEIASHLRERKVLVVWLIDASASLLEQRKTIGKRLHRIYGELGALEDAGQLTMRTQQALLTGVVTFGETTNFITTEPTDDFQKVYDAVAKAPTDPSGRENVFGAVDQVVHRWSKYRTSLGSRSLLLITVTDETGDDFENLEPAINTCRRYGAKASVIGPPAVFGRRKGFVPYVAKEDRKTYQLPVDLGPETFAIEAVSLPFWYGGPKFEYLSAGIGPYGLSRLVHETGGVYFMTNMTTTAGLTPIGKFDSDAMKMFQPDYRFGTPDAYLADINRHPIRRAVVAAAELSQKYKAKDTPTLDLKVTPRNYLQSLTDSQKSAAESTAMIDMILQAFPGNMEAEYKKEQSPRWRAGYDLALGRLLALKVRAYEYNFACAQLKQLGSGDIASKSNHFVFKPDSQIDSGAQMKKLAAEAERLLHRVLDEAPDTPWAMLAARELRDPLGFTVIQKFDPPPKPAEAAKKTITPATPPKKKKVLLANDTKKKPATAPAAPPKPPVLPKL